MARDYRAEYARRIARGLARGESRQAARGHRTTPERPSRAIAEPRKYPEYIGRLNQRRMSEGKGPIQAGEPPSPGPARRQMTFDTLEEAERHGQGVPPPYVTYYVGAGGVTVEIQRGTHRSQRRRAA